MKVTGRVNWSEMDHEGRWSVGGRRWSLGILPD